MNDFTLSIIVPVYNEIERLPGFLTQLQRQSKAGFELIVVDGGSDDGTWQYLRDWGEGIAIASAKGRAVQMNRGAQEARGNVLYFVHVDSLLPRHFDEALRSALRKGADAGCFRLGFDSSHLFLRWAARGSRYNHLLCRGGDQSLFVLRRVFEKLGGYDTRYVVCEDLNLIKLLYAISRFIVIPQTLITSARRFYEKGPVRLLFHFGILHLLHWIQVPPKVLHAYYKRFVNA